MIDRITDAKEKQRIIPSAPRAPCTTGRRQRKNEESRDVVPASWDGTTRGSEADRPGRTPHWFRRSGFCPFVKSRFSTIFWKVSPFRASNFGLP